MKIHCLADGIFWEQNSNAITVDTQLSIDIEGKEPFEASLHKYFMQGQNTKKKKHQFT